MNDYLEAIENLKSTLFNQEIVKTYFSLRKQIEESEEIKKLNDRLVELQKKMTLNINDDSVYFNCKKEYERTLFEYESHPLINNYHLIKDELFGLLQEIKSIIE